ncbi:MAG: flagellar hook-basal body complex protein FliE [Spirochaetota bacterium]
MVKGSQAAGDIVNLRATHQGHFGFQKAPKKEGDFISNFGNALKDAFYKVNNLQKRSDELSRALAVRPDSVDIHDVSIAAEKARLSLFFTKSITEKVTQAYKELINIR